MFRLSRPFSRSKAEDRAASWPYDEAGNFRSRACRSNRINKAATRFLGEVWVNEKG